MASSLLASPPSPSPPFHFHSPPAIQTSTSPVPFDPLSASFRPSIAVIIGVLTTMFSLTFLLLLYAKHCKRAAAGAMAAGTGGSHDQQLQQSGMNAAPPPPPLRGRDSGVDRAVIDALPVFSFASLHGLKDGLECAVCLSRFEKLDLLRLLPKCKHAFHLECVDTWLGSHSTCPLCRNRVEPEDVLIVEEFFNGAKIQVAAGEEQERQSSARASNYTAGRLSSAGSEAGIDRTLQLFVQRERDPSAVAACASFRLGRSLSCKKEPSLRKDQDCGKIETSLSAAMADKDLDAQFAQRLWHRIIVSDVVFQHRWSDFMPSDALLLDTQAVQADHQHLSFIPIGLDHRLMMINLNGTAQQRLSTSRTAGNGRTEDSSRNSISSSYYPNTGNGHQASAMADVASVTDNAPAMALDMELTSTINQSPEGGHVISSEKQAGLLKRALAAGMVNSGSRRTDSEATLLLMPTRYPRSLSEVSGMKRYADSHHNTIASAGKSRDDEETKKWLSIARKTLTWLTRQERSSLTSSTSRAFR